jgi:hypothetical protein
MLTGNEEDVDERPEQVPGVGGEEIERVERVRDRDHRHRPGSDSAQTCVIKRNRPIFVPSKLISEPGRPGIFIDNMLPTAR